ncbi:MAG: flagellin [Eubacteriales bacterium]
MNVLNTISNLQQSIREIAGLQQKISSGQKMQQISDDPSSLWKFFSIKKNLACHEQYNSNIDNGISWLNGADSAFGSANQVMQSALDIALSASNTGNNSTDFEAYAIKVDTLINQLIDVANTSVEDNYIFSNSKGKQPFIRQEDMGGGEEVIINPSITDTIFYDSTREILPRASVTVSFNGQSLFIDSSVFTHLLDLKDALDAKDSSAVNALMENLTNDQNLFIQARAEAGAKSNRLEMIKTVLENQNANLQKSLAGLQDTDIETATTELASRMLTYQATLSCTAKVLQISLLNFIS